MRESLGVRERKIFFKLDTVQVTDTHNTKSVCDVLRGTVCFIASFSGNSAHLREAAPDGSKSLAKSVSLKKLKRIHKNHGDLSTIIPLSMDSLSGSHRIELCNDYRHRSQKNEKSFEYVPESSHYLMYRLWIFNDCPLYRLHYFGEIYLSTTMPASKIVDSTTSTIISANMHLINVICR